MPFSNLDFPNIGIEAFIAQKTAGNDTLLYNILEGENHIEKPHKHDFFIIILFEKAVGEHEIDFINYPIEDKQIHLLFPDQVHKWNIQKNSKGYQLMINRVFFEHLIPYFRFSAINYINHPAISISNKNFELLKYEFNQIRREIESKNYLQELIFARASVIATIISTEIENNIQETKVFQSNPRLVKFQDLIEQYYKKEKTVAFYASKLHVTGNYLNILSKKHLNLSAIELIQNRVILEAKRLLQSTNETVKEIAFELGFADHAYFSNFFKNKTQLTPTQFREK
ncbi:helix-turn-helix domain-containing protein [Flavobacterium sp. I3-2]|uniref:helix-turn-helix domain-containing protein n=1 Tax=Flavobacterium sp. I3-2 TaxID=2748319 RepID=UPI0015AFC180|nr:helix-turn-helix domain-containing protein [Flavobacterium sp. I3-2]